MSNREKLKSLRPSIPTITEANQTSRFEQFQNRVLRPILKFQNDLLIEIFQQYIQKRKGVFHKLSHEKKKDYIAQSIQKDLKFRNLLIGLILGQFTLEEYQTFQEQERELTRRMSDLLIQRIQSQFCQLDY